jgi:hypothetical protein
MSKKISQKEFVKGLVKKTGCASNEEFGNIFGVSKSAVGLWINEKSPIPLDRFLSKFGRETLDWVKQHYELDDDMIGKSGEVLRREAEKIQYLIDSGLITFPCWEDCRQERKSPGNDRGEMVMLSDTYLTTRSEASPACTDDVTAIAACRSDASTTFA